MHFQVKIPENGGSKIFSDKKTKQDTADVSAC